LLEKLKKSKKAELNLGSGDDHLLKNYSLINFSRFFVKYLNAKLLKNINLVSTPSFLINEILPSFFHLSKIQFQFLINKISRKNLRTSQEAEKSPPRTRRSEKYLNRLLLDYVDPISSCSRSIFILSFYKSFSSSFNPHFIPLFMLSFVLNLK
jgi:hypothetical protein